jgi:hypothetical protein
MSSVSPERETRGPSQVTQIVLTVLGAMALLAALPFLFMGSMMASMLGGMMCCGMGSGWGMLGFALVFTAVGGGLLLLGLRRRWR